MNQLGSFGEFVAIAKAKSSGMELLPYVQNTNTWEDSKPYYQRLGVGLRIPHFLQLWNQILNTDQKNEIIGNDDWLTQIHLLEKADMAKFKIDFRALIKEVLDNQSP